LFANVSGDVNPAHLDQEYAEGTMFHGVIAHGMLGGSLFSTVLGTLLPGPGTIYLSQDLHFRRPVKPGDTLTAKVVVRETNAEKKRVVLDCVCTNQDGKDVISGTSEVIAPTEKVQRERMAMPEVSVIHHAAYQNLLARAAGLPPLPVAVVHPCDMDSLRATMEAAIAGCIDPVLIGPEAKIRAIADGCDLDLRDIPIVNAAHSHAAAQAAVALARNGKVKALMKGSLPTDELMHEVMRDDGGLRTARRVSHVFLFDVACYPRPLLITDAAINIRPTLDDKRDICQNAIDLARIVGIETPRVAILSAIETVTDKLPSTIDAAALCKMAERGQITGGLLDGPLAFDNAVSPQAARIKGLTSPVAGQADILLVPDLESGNMLAKQLIFFGQAEGAGIVAGARLPIILTSRADPLRARVASAAIALLMADARRHKAI
jgi:phosphotransacetylase/acyl dehydratase